MQTYKTKLKKTGSSPITRMERQSAVPDFTGNIDLRSSGRSLKLPEVLRERVQSQFGFSPESIRIKESPQIADMGAKAMAQGNIISFAPGKFDPYTESGQSLIGHELSHIVQQAKGLGSNIEGSNIHYNPSSESASDAAGRAFASNGANFSQAPSVTPAAPSLAPVQGKGGWFSKRRNNRSNQQVPVNSPPVSNVSPVNNKPKEKYGSHNNFVSSRTPEEMQNIKTLILKNMDLRKTHGDAFTKTHEGQNKDKPKGPVVMKSSPFIMKVRMFNELKGKGVDMTGKTPNDMVLPEDENNVPVQNNESSTGSPGGIDAREVWQFTGGRTGDDLQKYYSDLGSGEMGKQQPILDEIYDDVTSTLMDFDFEKAMNDEDYIFKNIDKAIKISDQNQASVKLDLTKRGYKMSDRNKDILNDDTRMLQVAFANYLNTLLRKHGMSPTGDVQDQYTMNYYANDIDESGRGKVLPYLANMKNLQKKHGHLKGIDDVPESSSNEIEILENIPEQPVPQPVQPPQQIVQPPRQPGRKNPNEKLHNKYRKFLQNEKDVGLTYDSITGPKGLSGFDKRMASIYARGMSTRKQEKMWRDMQRGGRYKDKHDKRVWKQIMKSTAAITNKKYTDLNYMTQNFDDFQNTLYDTNMRNNFMMANPGFKPKAHEQSLIDNTQDLGNMINAWYAPAMEVYGMETQGTPETRIKFDPNQSDQDLKEYQKPRINMMTSLKKEMTRKEGTAKSLYEKGAASTAAYKRTEYSGISGLLRRIFGG